ncbi:hypothetical protein F2Q68_00015849 [Brassica cretica]|uniref:Uncharacterized protein n=1 Tax=Brassica cretica TaxID=69181 RepID=A0A8S9HJQ6_BRACR|nr:hypothetical protein F2Q68_00015849 [Brassica cretica]
MRNTPKTLTTTREEYKILIPSMLYERRRDVTRKEGRRDVTTAEITEVRRRDVTMKEGGRRRDGTTISTSPTDLDGQVKTVATANKIASSSIEKESETRKEGRYNCVFL